jgi:hypothetical protein
MSRIAYGLVLLIAACGTTKGNNPNVDAGSNSGSDGGPPGGNAVPRAGAWQYNEVTPVSNTCPSNTPTIENGAFVIDTVTATSFRIVPNDGTAPFTCSLSSTGFDCPNRGNAVEDLHPGLDAIVNAHAVANGSFSTSTHGTGRQEATVTCTGTQCNALGASFPCTIKVDFKIDAQ